MEFDDVFRDLEKAVVQKQEIKCFKQQSDNAIRWIIEISEPKKAREFESRLNTFFQALKRKFRGEYHVTTSA